MDGLKGISWGQGDTGRTRPGHGKEHVRLVGRRVGPSGVLCSGSLLDSQLTRFSRNPALFGPSVNPRFLYHATSRSSVISLSKGFGLRMMER